MKRDRFFNSDRSGSGGNSGSRRSPRRPNRMSDPEPEPEDEKTWNELERESEVDHFEKLGRSMQKGVQIEAERQAPSAIPYPENMGQILDAIEARIRANEPQQALALIQRPISVNVPQPLGRVEPEVGKGNMVALGIGAFVVGGVLGFLIGRSTR